jgi:hypothetical protein
MPVSNPRVNVALLPMVYAEHVRDVVVPPVTTSSIMRPRYVRCVAALARM